MEKYEKTEFAGPTMGSCALLTLVFTVLKLSGQISWSWVWVFSPLWLPWAFFGSLFLVLFSFWLAVVCLKRALES